MVRRFGFSEMLTGVTMALVEITVLSGAVLASVPVSADDDASVDDVSIVVPTACTLSGTGTGTHAATINPGQYVADIGTTTLKAICNDANGFAIYATGYTGNTIGETNSNKLVGQNTSETIVTGLATSGDTSNWAMKLATDPNATYPITIESAPNTSGGSSASFASYHVVPNEYTKVATRLQSTDVGTTATGSTLTTTYASFITAGQVGDTYDGKVIYTIVHPNTDPAPMAPLLASDCTAYTICYAPNANDIDGSMDSINSTKITKSPTAGVQMDVNYSPYSEITDDSEVALISPNYSRDGYGFAGWSTDFRASNSSIVFGPNETITIASDGTGDADVSQHGLILYPVWIASTGDIQDWTGCNTLTQASYDSETGALSATLASMTALTDKRDGNTYTVARLTDGNCWMTENLRINAEDTRGEINQALAQGYGDATTNGCGKYIGLADSESFFGGRVDRIDAMVSANSLYYAGTQSGTAIMDIGQVNYGNSRIPRYSDMNTDRELAPADGSIASGSFRHWYSYGNYYNWPAAMANTDYYSSSSVDADGFLASEAVGTSICPSGWKLPYGRNSGKGITAGGFAYLDRSMGGTGTSSVVNAVTGDSMSAYWRQFPNNFVLSGEFSGPSTVSRGSYGWYWTSSSVGTSAYYFMLSFADSYLADNTETKYVAMSARCLLYSQ